MNINDFKAIHHFVKGIFGKSEREYELSFVQDPDDRWFIDMPWDGDCDNLEMVCCSDDMLTHIAKGDNRVTLKVVVDSIEGYAREEFVRLEQTKSSLTGGAWYKPSNIDFTKNIWICPVTLCVLGRYPKLIFFKRIA